MKRILLAITMVFALSGCYTSLLIPSIGFNKPIISGGQDTIDAGHVTDVTGWCPSDSRHLAGHRTTHGAVFNALPSGLKVGHHVVIYENQQAKDYVVTSVTHEWDCNGIWGDLVLQTTHPDGGVYIWHLRRD